MTKDEFEAAYASAGHTTIEVLHAWGRWAEPCHCGEEDCRGWKMGYQWEDAIIEKAVRSGQTGYAVMLFLDSADDRAEAERRLLGQRIVGLVSGMDEVLAGVILEDGTEVRSACDDSGSWVTIEEKAETPAAPSLERLRELQRWYGGHDHDQGG